MKCPFLGGVCSAADSGTWRLPVFFIELHRLSAGVLFSETVPTFLPALQTQPDTGKWYNTAAHSASYKSARAPRAQVRLSASAGNMPQQEHTRQVEQQRKNNNDRDSPSGTVARPYCLLQPGYFLRMPQQQNPPEKQQPPEVMLLKITHRCATLTRNVCPESQTQAVGAARVCSHRSVTAHQQKKKTCVPRLKLGSLTLPAPVEPRSGDGPGFPFPLPLPLPFPSLSRRRPGDLCPSSFFTF